MNGVSSWLLHQYLEDVVATSRIIFLWGLRLDSLYYQRNQNNISLQPFDDPCFDWSLGLCFGGLTFKNRGHLGSRSRMSSHLQKIRVFRFVLTPKKHHVRQKSGCICGSRSLQDLLRDPAVPRGKDLELRIDEVSTNILADEPLNHRFLGSSAITTVYRYTVNPQYIRMPLNHNTVDASEIRRSPVDIR